ncbi:uncharacterized protein LOC144445111 [Glandiceps talaboti]
MADDTSEESGLLLGLNKKQTDDIMKIIVSLVVIVLILSTIFIAVVLVPMKKTVKVTDNESSQNLTCEVRNGGCEQTCQEQYGNIVCSCQSGFKLQKNNKNCSDINECNNNAGGCDQICTNMDGSYQCDCRFGFVLAEDGRTCIEGNTIDATTGIEEKPDTTTLLS